MSCKRQPGLYVAADLSGLKVAAQNGFPSVRGSVGVQREGTAQEGVLGAHEDGTRSTKPCPLQPSWDPMTLHTMSQKQAGPHPALAKRSELRMERLILGKWKQNKTL